MSLFGACALTVLIEAPFMALFGLRDKRAVTVVVCANAITNLTLNLAMQLWIRNWSPPVVLSLEALVVAAEYAIYARAFGPSARLLLVTLAANALSYGAGRILI